MVGRRARVTQRSGDFGSRMGKGTLPKSQEAQFISSMPQGPPVKPCGALRYLICMSTTWPRPLSVPSRPLPHPSATASHIWEPRAGPNQCELVCDYQHVCICVVCACVFGGWGVSLTVSTCVGLSLSMSM